MFCNVPEKAVISLKDVDSIYKIPGLLKSQGLDDYICKRFSLNCPEANLSEWEQVIFEEANPVSEVTIGMVGKYIELPDAYKSVIEALKHGGLKNRVSVNIKLIDSQDAETRGVEIPRSDATRTGGFGYIVGVEGMIDDRAFWRVRTIFLIQEHLPGMHAGGVNWITPAMLPTWRTPTLRNLCQTVSTRLWR